MAAFNGTEFKLFLDSTTDVEFDQQSELTINVNVDTIEYTNKDSGGWKEVGYGLRSWGGSCNLVVDFQEATKKSVKDVITAIVNRAMLNVVTKKTTETTGDYSFTGTIKIDSVDISAPMEDKVTYSFNFTGTGALTPASAV